MRGENGMKFDGWKWRRIERDEWTNEILLFSPSPSMEEVELKKKGGKSDEMRVIQSSV